MPMPHTYVHLDGPTSFLGTNRDHNLWKELRAGNSSLWSPLQQAAKAGSSRPLLRPTELGSVRSAARCFQSWHHRHHAPGTLCAEHVVLVPHSRDLLATEPCCHAYNQVLGSASQPTGLFLHRSMPHTLSSTDVMPSARSDASATWFTMQLVPCHLPVLPDGTQRTQCPQSWSRLWPHSCCCCARRPAISMHAISVHA